MVAVWIIGGGHKQGVVPSPASWHQHSPAQLMPASQQRMKPHQVTQAAKAQVWKAAWPNSSCLQAPPHNGRWKKKTGHTCCKGNCNTGSTHIVPSKSPASPHAHHNPVVGAGSLMTCPGLAAHLPRRWQRLAGTIGSLLTHAQVSAPPLPGERRPPGPRGEGGGDLAV